jgi:hypothetical protein
MKKLGNLLRKDIVLGIKDVFLLLEIVFSVVFMLVLLFLIPEDIRTEGHVYIWDRTGIIEEFVTDYVPDPGQSLGEYFVYNREDLITGITDDRNAVGLIINAAGQERYEVEMLSQPYTKESLARFIEADMEDLMNILQPPMGRYPADVYSSVRIEAFQRGVDEVQPFNQRLLAPVIVFNIGLIGLFAMVSLIGQERMDATLRAYRLSPSSLGLFLLSKKYRDYRCEHTEFQHSLPAHHGVLGLSGSAVSDDSYGDCNVFHRCRPGDVLSGTAGSHRLGIRPDADIRPSGGIPAQSGVFAGMVTSDSHLPQPVRAGRGHVPR